MITEELFEQMVTVALQWLDEADYHTRREFVKLDARDMIKFHHSVGQDIRNHFKLWTYGWEPMIENGIDMSPDHPDAVSNRVLVEVHRRARIAEYG